MSKFTVQQLMEATRAVALERPDHIANPDGEKLCEYFTEDGPPDCVVGHAFARLNLDDDTLYVIKARNTIKVSLLLEDLDVRGDTGWLTAVQQQQDAGYSWGEAVRIADGEAG